MHRQLARREILEAPLADRVQIVRHGAGELIDATVHSMVRISGRANSAATRFLISTYVADREAIEDSAGEPNRDVPIFMAHGRFDPVIPFALAEKSRDFLESRGYSVQWHEYPMEHSVHPDEIEAISEWLAEVVGR